jgi:cytochrome P450
MSRDRPEWIEKIRKDGLETPDQIAKNKSLGLVIKEILRLHSPVLAAFFR